MKLTSDQEKQLLSLIVHFSYRVRFVAFNPKTNNFRVYAEHDKEKMDLLNKNGYLTFQYF